MESNCDGVRGRAGNTSHGTTTSSGTSLRITDDRVGGSWWREKNVAWRGLRRNKHLPPPTASPVLPTTDAVRPKRKTGLPCVQRRPISYAVGSLLLSRVSTSPDCMHSPIFEPGQPKNSTDADDTKNMTAANKHALQCQILVCPPGRAYLVASRPKFDTARWQNPTVPSPLAEPALACIPSTSMVTVVGGSWLVIPGARPEHHRQHQSPCQRILLSPKGASSKAGGTDLTP